MKTSRAAYVEIARIDHSIKNIFVLPGLIVALSIDPARWRLMQPGIILAGLLAVGLVASSNYVLNEILDAAYDRLHPFKARRAIAAGRASVPAAYVEWVALMLAGIGLGLIVSAPFTITLAGLWIAGCLYNVPPIRTKDIVYLDVISEAVNNPLRMLAGWYLTGTGAVPITSLLLSYWAAGCYFMAIKRYAEWREMPAERLRAYRKSLGSYSERSLLTSILLYASLAMLFFGAFIARYRLELILSFPLVALVMAVYFWLAFREKSPVQHPELLYREPKVVVPVALCAAVMAALLFVDLPALHKMFVPTEALR
jgi:decaprenyl-phosphate phosphoribosyltransferase